MASLAVLAVVLLLASSMISAQASASSDALDVLDLEHLAGLKYAISPTVMKRPSAGRRTAHLRSHPLPAPSAASAAPSRQSGGYVVLHRTNMHQAIFKTNTCMHYHDSVFMTISCPLDGGDASGHRYSTGDCLELIGDFLLPKATCAADLSFLADLQGMQAVFHYPSAASASKDAIGEALFIYLHSPLNTVTDLQAHPTCDRHLLPNRECVDLRLIASYARIAKGFDRGTLTLYALPGGLNNMRSIDYIEPVHVLQEGVFVNRYLVMNWYEDLVEAKSIVRTADFIQDLATEDLPADKSPVLL